MKYSYKITKYDSSKEKYDEWTSISDIKDISTYQEYIKIESSYINSILEICKNINISSLTIKELEIKQDGMSQKYTEGQDIDILNIDTIIRSVLREKLWCKLISKDCEFHFGYDYYMYVVTNENIQDSFKKFDSVLYVEEFKSPYLNK